MEKEYQKLLSKLSYKEPSNGLESKIIMRVEAEERRQARLGAIYSWSGTAASFVLSLFIGSYLAQSVKQSGFLGYFSLIISENVAIAGYWKELSFSLMESLPILGAAALLASLGLLIWSVSKTFNKTRGISMIFN